MKAIVVGGGVGGLCTAIRLGAAGHDVTVFERNEQIGGKLAVFERDGFTFDIGPSLLTLPQVFDDVFQLAGTSLAERAEPRPARSAVPVLLARRGPARCPR